MLTEEKIRAEIREYLLAEVLPGEDSADLKDTTELITGGILDSISTAKLVESLERSYSIRFKASEVNSTHLNTVNQIVTTVLMKSTA